MCAQSRASLGPNRVNNGVIGPLALGPLHPTNLTSVLRVGNSRLCQKLP
jgi:hypothetical protein